MYFIQSDCFQYSPVCTTAIFPEIRLKKKLTYIYLNIILKQISTHKFLVPGTGSPTFLEPMAAFKVTCEKIFKMILKLYYFQN